MKNNWLDNNTFHYSDLDIFLVQGCTLFNMQFEERMKIPFFSLHQLYTIR